MLRVEILVKGQLDEEWSEWFNGMSITHTDKGQTILSGVVSDQSALYGMISKLRDLGLELVSISSTDMTHDPGMELPL